MVITFTGFTTINIYSQVGLITLVGLISKNAILIVEFANQAQAQGNEQVGGDQGGLHLPAEAGAHDHGRYRFWPLPAGIG